MSINDVRKYFEKYNMQDNILEFDSSSATVSLAAKALNTEEERIAKSLSFIVENDPIIIVMAGNVKVDNKLFKKEFNTKAKMIDSSSVYDLIGHKIGGVCPFGIKECVKVYLDESLKKYDYVYPAAGAYNSAIKLTIDELENYSQNFCKWINVSKL